MHFDDQAHREWLAWRQLCKQLKLCGVDINAQIPLARAIKLWGEELHQLRLESSKHDAEELDQRRAEYRDHVLDGWAP